MDQFLGQQAEVLMEEQILVEGIPHWVGHTREYVRVAVPSGENLQNKLVQVMTKSRHKDQMLLAELRTS